jgi:hypothetical protein
MPAVFREAIEGLSAYQRRDKSEGGSDRNGRSKLPEWSRPSYTPATTKHRQTSTAEAASREGQKDERKRRPSTP